VAISRNQRLKMLKEVSAAFLQLRKTISSINDEDLAKPNTAGIWSGKDVISHIADWEAAFMRVIIARNQGKPEVWPTDDPGVNLDAWNEAQVIARADWSVDEVKEYLEQTHDDLMEQLEKLPDLDRAEALHYTKEHYDMHYDDLAASRSSTASQTDEPA
jgi:uncharacterized damage-inducible protein DinB